MDRSVYNGDMQGTDSEVIHDLPPRERILLTAHELFYRDGIRATGIDRVIAESGVTKVTFYRQFPSKNGLIRAYLEYRHERWLSWFIEALQRHGSARRNTGLNALVPTLAEWLRDDSYRGCAFINSVGELGSTLPEITEIARRHKQEITDVIASLLPPSRQRRQNAQAAALAMDGAIVRAQFDETPDAALKVFERVLKLLQASTK